MSDNKKTVLNWDDFKALGNPDNADPEPIEEVRSSYKIPLKVHYERKGRGGKEAIIIRGLEQDLTHDMEAICKTLKTKMGLGGAVKENEIILAGSNRDKIIEILSSMGFTNIKKAGG
jgi:translation initiation factor 1